jgi:hypothetical protein
MRSSAERLRVKESRWWCGGAHPTFCNYDRAHAWPPVAERCGPSDTLPNSLYVQHCSSTVQQQLPHIRQMARILENNYLFALPFANLSLSGHGEVWAWAGLIAHYIQPAPPDLGTIPLHRTRLRNTWIDSHIRMAI